jgi:hypothetical protein
MDKKQQLLARLDEIGQSLEQTGYALALLGLGSVGVELDRLDEYSDLDFFVVVQDGYKTAFIENLDWLSHVYPVVYAFKNTADGYKLLFEDDIFCEFAVFETAELTDASYTEGRIVWKDPSFDESLRAPKKKPQPKPPNAEHLVGEALTNLYVGLGRYHRGEKLSACRFIQGYAVDRIVGLTALIEAEQPAHRDPFTPERRYEQRFPQMAELLPQMLQGYGRTIESAQAILQFLETHFEVNTAIKELIQTLCRPQLSPEKIETI